MVMNKVVFGIVLAIVWETEAFQAKDSGLHCFNCLKKMN